MCLPAEAPFWFSISRSGMAWYGSIFYHPKIDWNWIELDGLSSRSLKMTSWWVQTVTRCSKLQAQGSAVFSAVCLKQLPLRDGSKLWNHKLNQTSLGHFE